MIPSDVMHCQMMLEKANTNTNFKKEKPSMLSAFLVAVVLEKLSKVLTNYAEVFIPLKDLIMKLLFVNSPQEPNQIDDCVPYFAVASYFALAVIIIIK